MQLAPGLAEARGALPAAATAAPVKISPRASSVSAAGVATVEVANPNRHVLRGTVTVTVGGRTVARRSVGGPLPRPGLPLVRAVQRSRPLDGRLRRDRRPAGHRRQPAGRQWITGSTQSAGVLKGTLGMSFVDSKYDFITNKIIFINCAGSQSFEAVPAG